MANDGRFNPLAWAWNLLAATCGTIIFGSMLEAWFTELVTWRGFIDAAIEFYRSLINPVVEATLGWLPRGADGFGDYIAIGILIATSAYISTLSAYRSRGIRANVSILGYLLVVFLWPYFIFFVVSAFRWRRAALPDELVKESWGKDTHLLNVFGARWLVALIIGSGLLLGINALMHIDAATTCPYPPPIAFLCAAA